ncbi:MAG: hypothetical protein M3342_10240 [Bacteroidota bacterium]|nr:hypothetical protein [Bacteroidota bacterium]
MKYLLVLLLAMHGLIHLIGFVKQWDLAPVTGFSGQGLVPLSKNLSQIIGILWLAVCLAFLFSAVSVLLHKSWWWAPALTALFVSQVLIFFYWNDAKWGTVANVIVLLIGLVAWGNWKFNHTVQDEITTLLTSPDKKDNTIITSEMLQSLPLPVQNWLQHSGIVGKEKIHFVRLKQRGWMRTKPEQEKWIEAAAEQYFTVDEPAFIWKVKMNMLPLVPVTGRDKWVNGKGQMEIKAFSLINIVNQANEKIDQGALQRYLAEICWFPSAALSPYIHWQAIDATSAKATITYKGITGSVIFYFNEQGDMIGCSADRYMGGGREAKLEKWEVTSKGFAIKDGVRMPVKSEATWKLKSGDFTWYKLEITDVEYNHPTSYN